MQRRESQRTVPCLGVFAAPTEIRVQGAATTIHELQRMGPFRQVVGEVFQSLQLLAEFICTTSASRSSSQGGCGGSRVVEEDRIVAMVIHLVSIYVYGGSCDCERAWVVRQVVSLSHKESSLHQPANWKLRESLGTDVYMEDPPWNKVSLLVIQEPVYVMEGSVSSNVVLTSVALRRPRGH